MSRPLPHSLAPPRPSFPSSRLYVLAALDLKVVECVGGVESFSPILELLSHSSLASLGRKSVGRLAVLKSVRSEVRQHLLLLLDFPHPKEGHFP